eukprot:CAMPEP_0170603758 /NCGR_PEP_ID=MMETSP0224-20130122/19076_1 /TAXON_ID=285029 /ORGANISM="Togula jolla, Strain CCCM 725" /LENGTH=198 /DNA_ID=CAMNT_0010928647 /DNA_START=244 /DNA_END=840 /DNA_ORIENTATION=+
MGKCARGIRCSFAHADEEVQVQPDLFRTQPCRDFLKARCTRGEACPFAHRAEDLRVSPPDSMFFTPVYSAPLVELDLFSTRHAPLLASVAGRMAVSRGSRSASDSSSSYGYDMATDSSKNSLDSCEGSLFLAGGKESWSRQSTGPAEEDCSLGENREVNWDDDDRDVGVLQLALKNTFLEAVPLRVPGALRRALSAGP